MTDVVLCENKWVSLIERTLDGHDPYVYSHETRCQGRIVALLPYRVKVVKGIWENTEYREYLVKSEMTPCWTPERIYSAITGGYEGGDIADDAVKEMLEETGYVIDKDELISLGTSYASKSSDTVYSLFTVDLTDKQPGDANGDGTEETQQSVWISGEEIKMIQDPQVSVMYIRLQH